jgi:hypothetical protein
MSNSEILAIYPDASIRIIRLSEAVTSAELFLWPAGTAGISAIGADRHEALQRLEKQIRGLADAVSGTFSSEVCSDE